MYDFETDIILLQRNLSLSYTLIEINNIDDYIEKNLIFLSEIFLISQNVWKLYHQLNIYC